MPNFLSTTLLLPSARLLLSPTDPYDIQMRGTVSVPFTVMIPNGLADRKVLGVGWEHWIVGLSEFTPLDFPSPGPLIQYGHGLFANQSEIYDPVRQQEAFNKGWWVCGDGICEARSPTQHNYTLPSGSCSAATGGACPSR